jgi:phosphatidylinositol kinase/protein kinase (PI-3  family)
MVNALSGHDPVVKTVTSLISIATNPYSLSKMQELYCPWF